MLAGSARDTERVWREIAQGGNGRFITIPQDGGEIVVIETPFDDEIIILQKQINGTVIPYGPRATQKRVEDRTRQLASVAAAAPAQATEMASYLNKRSVIASEAVTGGGDLTADVATGRQKVTALKDDELPDELRKLSAEERQKTVEKQIGTRKLLNDKLAALVGKRDRYVTEQKAKSPAKPASSFDRVVEETLKAQTKR